MHLWPSVMLRDSFSVEYLNTVERNLHQMNIEKRQRRRQQQQQQQQNPSNCRQQKLLETDKRDSEDPWCGGGINVFVRELFMILSCCYCCFGCGACIDDEDR